jgi:hypothetical protein
MHVIDRNRRRLLNTEVGILAVRVLTASASAQSVKEIRGTSPYNTRERTRAKVIVDSPLPEPLSCGIVELHYRAENVHIAPVFGAGAVSVDVGDEE